MRTLTKSILVAIILAFSCVSAWGNAPREGMVSVEAGAFKLNGKNYKYVGTNMWYAAMLAS